ncbi:MAG TPA: 16S rRNA (cytosine(967)-C(5))-methyltransferase RsmB [Candidatus Binatia bacterium]|nr:16S rRNA (cytosine(967)-C(5))-methyltransferase RsmB [Candidatus Binatia bacterium]
MRDAPSISPARTAAFDVLLRVERDAAFASELLHSAHYEKVSRSNHALATELVMGVLRWRSRLDDEIAHQVSQPFARLDLEVATALRLGVYQLRWLDRIPARAAINESVDLVKRARKRSAAPLVNAVLRKIEALAAVDPYEEIPGSNSAAALAQSSAHPLWLVASWIGEYGIEAARQICLHDQTVPVTTIRLRSDEAESRLRSEGIELAPGALLAGARRVMRGNVAISQTFRQGLVAIQDEGSQLVAALVGRGLHILDCCAAPGGKTLALSDNNPGTPIVAAEIHPHRARLLKQLVNRESNVQVVASDARKLPLDATFDRVLADVPCSGTGTLGRNPEIKWRLTPADLADLPIRQLAILRAAMERVPVGGRVVYSTCSLQRAENENVVEQAVAGTAFRILECAAELQRLQREGNLVWKDIRSLARGPYLQTLPGVHPCDGFFAAVLEKAG